MMESLSGIRIEEQVIGSQHVFTSPDVPGLCVAHADRRIALDDVGPTIAAMERVRRRIAAHRDGEGDVGGL